MNKLKKNWFLLILLLALFGFPVLSPAADFSATNDSFNSIRIIRDEYGVPHIYAKNIFDLYFGYGYITAEDRLFQIEMLRRSVCGTVSEVLGKDFIELDKSSLRDGYSNAEIEERIGKLEPVCARILEMFAMGVNKKISEFEKTPGSMPYEFKKFGFKPQKWNAAAVASVYIGTMAVRYSDFTSEMDNMNLLNKLKAKFGDKKAMEIFEDITPVNDENSPTTINEAGCSPSYGKASLNEPENASSKSICQLYSNGGAYRAALKNNKDALARLGLPVKLGSYTYLLSGSRSATGNAILASGPQMGFFNPAYLIEVGLHSPEIDIVGATTPCYMNIMFGMNRDLAFTATAGVGNLTDVYAEKLNPANPDEYLFNKEYKKFDKRRFEINVKGRRRPLKVEFLRSVHGPVFEIDRKNGVAYSKKRAWEGFELDSMFEWMMAVNAKNFGELKYHFSKNPISINMLAINRKGETYHFLSGRYPVRNPRFDDRLPLPGTGEAEWQGFFPGETNPSSKNEAEGFIANWNSKPTRDFRNGDLATQWGPDQRTAFIQDQLRSREKFDLAGLYEIHKKIGYTDLRAYIFAPMIIKFLESDCAQPYNESVNTCLKLLKSWNFERRGGADGRYDSPAVALFDALWRETMDSLFADELGDMLWTVESETFWTQSILLYYTLSRANGAPAALNHDYTNGAGLKNLLTPACERTIKKLRGEYKTEDPQKWLKPVQMMAFETNNFVRVPQADASDLIQTPMVNRGTENHFVELGPDYTIAYNINPPGQSGYKAVSENFSSKHTRDQLDLFNNYKGFKPMRFEIKDVIKNKSAEKFIFKN